MVKLIAEARQKARCLQVWILQKVQGLEKDRVASLEMELLILIFRLVGGGEMLGSWSAALLDGDDSLILRAGGIVSG